jgi:hypothetical protein
MFSGSAKAILCVAPNTYSRRFADFDTELHHLTVNLGYTSERVLATHPPDEPAHFLRHGWSSALTVATLPFPEQTKSLALPANDRICFDNHRRAPPFRPPAGQPSPKPTIWRSMVVVSRIAAEDSVDDEEPGFQSEARYGYETSQRER